MNRVKTTVAYSSMTTVDFCVSMGVLALLIAGALVLIGMSTPLWTRLGGPPSNVTLRYYFLATTPVALILLLALSVFPFMRWIKPSRPFIAPQAAIPFTAAMVAGIFAILAGVHEPLYIVLLTLGTFATVSNAWLVVDRLRTKKSLAGAYIAHVGLAMLVVGAAVSTAYEKKEQVALPLGQPVEKMGWVLTYEGKDLGHPKGETPYHVLVSRPGSDEAYRCSPQQYMLPYDKGMMRKPAVKKFWTKDLYISPLDEVGGADGGQTAILERGKTQTLAGFDVTFLGFEMPGHDAGDVSKVGCPVEIVADMMIDTLTPALENTPQGLKDLPVTFGDGRYTLSVARIEAGSGRVELKLADRDDPNATTPVFWIELAEKPLINLFWLGTTLMVFGGLLALRKRERQWHDQSPAATPEQESMVALGGGSTEEIASATHRG
jgi:cytochrome c-type biogenesis protein CcmF